MITNQLIKQEKLVMKDDIMFKAFFSRVGSEKFLKDFLSAILGKNMKIKKVIHDSRLEQLARESKYGVLDLDVELDDGEIINIEMQLKNYHNIRNGQAMPDRFITIIYLTYTLKKKKIK